MGNALIIPLALIDPHPANVREHLGDLTDLAESIRRKGVLQSVVVRPNNSRFQLITGHRRCAASRLVGRTEVPAIVRPEATDADVVEDMLMENHHRRRLNPIEEANAFQALKTMRGWSQQQVAAAVGVSTMTVGNRLALLELSDDEQRAIVNKAMSLGEGWEIVHARRWEAGERRGQPKGNHLGKEAKGRWVQHFNTDHPLAAAAREYCQAAHTAPRATKLSDLACGWCWEAVIRREAVEELRRAGLLEQRPAEATDRPAADLAGAGLGDPELGADLRQRPPVEQPLDDVAVVGG